MDATRRTLSILMLNHAYLVEPLRALGHTVFSLGHTPTMLSDPFDVQLSALPILSLEDLTPYLPEGFTPEVIVFNDSSEFPRIVGLDKARVPTLFFSIDAHVHASWHKFFGGGFDHVLLAQPDYLPQFQDINPSTTWFPLWADTWCNPAATRPIDASFRGSFSPTTQPERIQFFEELSKLIEVDFGGGSYAEAYSQSKIVINHVWKNDLNFRVFEGMGCGGLMITPRINNGLLELFKEGEDLVCYENENPEDAARTIQRFLDNQDELRRIAMNGFTKVQRYHNETERAKTLSTILLNLSSRPHFQKHLNVAIAYLHNNRALPKEAVDLRFRMTGASVEALINYAQAGGPKDETFSALTGVVCEALRELGEEQLAAQFSVFARS
jgi:hypothetical protein